MLFKQGPYCIRYRIAKDIDSACNLATFLPTPAPLQTSATGFLRDGPISYPDNGPNQCSSTDSLGVAGASNIAYYFCLQAEEILTNKNLAKTR